MRCYVDSRETAAMTSFPLFHHLMSPAVRLTGYSQILLGALQDSISVSDLHLTRFRSLQVAETEIDLSLKLSQQPIGCQREECYIIKTSRHTRVQLNTPCPKYRTDLFLNYIGPIWQGITYIFPALLLPTISSKSIDSTSKEIISI